MKKKCVFSCLKIMSFTFVVVLQTVLATSAYAEEEFKAKKVQISGDKIWGKLAECCEVKGGEVGFECPKKPATVTCLQKLAPPQGHAVEQAWTKLIQSFEGKKSAYPAEKCIENSDSKMSTAIHSDSNTVWRAIGCLEKIIPSKKVREVFKEFVLQYVLFDGIAKRCLIADNELIYTPPDAKGDQNFTPKVQKFNKKCRPELVFSSKELKTGDIAKKASRSTGDDGREGFEYDAKGRQKAARLLPENKAETTHARSENNKEGIPWGGVNYEKCDALFPNAQPTENCPDCNLKQDQLDAQAGTQKDHKFAKQLNQNPFDYERKVLRGEDKSYGKMTSVSYLELLRLEGYERTLKAACWNLGLKPVPPKSCGGFTRGHKAFDCAQVAEVQPWAPPSDHELATELAGALSLYEKAKEQIEELQARYRQLMVDNLPEAQSPSGMAPQVTPEMREIKNQIAEIQKYMGSIVSKNPMLAAGVPSSAEELWNPEKLPTYQLLKKRGNLTPSVEFIKPFIKRLKKFAVNDVSRSLNGFCERDPNKGGIEDSEILKLAPLEQGLQKNTPDFASTFKSAHACLKGKDATSIKPSTFVNIGVGVGCGVAMLGPQAVLTGAACSTYFLADALRDKNLAEKKAEWTQACMKATNASLCDYDDYVRAQEEYESAASAVKFGLITLPLDYGALHMVGVLAKGVKNLPASKVKDITKLLRGLSTVDHAAQESRLAKVADIMGIKLSELKAARLDTAKRYLEEAEKAGDALRAAKASKDSGKITKAQHHLDAVMADKKTYALSKEEMLNAQKSRVAEHKSLISKKYDDITDPEVRAALEQKHAAAADDLGTVAKKAEADGVKVKAPDDLPLVSKRELARTQKDFPDLYKMFPDESETTVSRAIQALEKEGYSASDVKRILTKNKKNCGMFPGQLDYCASIAGSIEKRFTDPKYLKGAKAKSQKEITQYTEERFVRICRIDCPGECVTKHSLIPGYPDDGALVCTHSYRTHEQEKLKRAEKYGFSW